GAQFAEPQQGRQHDWFEHRPGWLQRTTGRWSARFDYAAGSGINENGAGPAFEASEQSRQCVPAGHTQNISRSATWMRRPGRVDVIWPNCVFTCRPCASKRAVVSRPENWVWLNAL